MTQYDNEQLERLEPGYLARYGLSTAPFSPTYEDRLVYLDAERTQRLDMLQHLTQFSDLLLLITGEHDIGKTTLMRHFIAGADEDWRICQVDASPMMHADQLLRQIATGFGLQPLPDEPAQLQQVLYQQLVAFQHRALVPILIIDDAHDLPVDALETLFNLADTQGGDGNLLRIILFCEPHIEKTLQTPAIQPLRERITHTLDIPPLSEEQVAEYLRHRMSVCGAQGDTPFTPRVVRRIHRASNGVPGRINQLAHGVLRDGRLSDTETISPERVKTRQLNPQYLFVALVVLLLAGIGFGYQDEINALFRGTPPATPDSPPRETGGNDVAMEPAAGTTAVSPPAPATTPAPPAPAATEQAAEQTIEFQVGAAEQPIPVVSTGPGDTTQPPPPAAPPAAEPVPAAAPAPNDTGASENVPADTAAASTPAPTRPPVRIDSLTPTRVVGSNRQQILKLRGDGFSDTVTVTVSWDGGEKSLPKSRISIINRNALTFAITTGTSAGTWRVTVSDPETGSHDTFAFRVQAPLVKPAEKTTARKNRGNSWWQKQNPKFFSIQLLTASQEKTAREFLRQHTFEYDTGYITIRSGGAPRYTVLLGVFPSRRNAQAALQTLPAEVRKLKPWVRQLSGVLDKLSTESASTSPPGSTPDGSPPPLAASPSAAMPTDPAAHTGWLWSQNPQYFTLQLLGSHEEARVIRFVRDHRLQGKTVWFHTRQKDRDWYALVYGVYPTRAAALRARNALPAELRKASPWVRSFASIHAEIKAP